MGWLGPRGLWCSGGGDGSLMMSLGGRGTIRIESVICSFE